MFFFTWLRRMARDAVLAGLNDVANELSEGGLDQAALALRQRLEALPAPEQSPAEQPEVETAGNGRSRRK